MKISIDTKEDSHDDLKRVIRMLQNLVGESTEPLTNQPGLFSEQKTENIKSQEEEDKLQQSTDNLFADLFNQEEIDKMKESENDETKEDEDSFIPENKKPIIEFY